jgi:hypothetical protein
VFCTTIGQGENKPEIENINHMHPTQVYIWDSKAATTEFRFNETRRILGSMSITIKELIFIVIIIISFSVFIFVILSVVCIHQFSVFL